MEGASGEQDNQENQALAPHEAVETAGPRGYPPSGHGTFVYSHKKGESIPLRLLSSQKH